MRSTSPPPTAAPPTGTCRRARVGVPAARAAAIVRRQSARIIRSPSSSPAFCARSAPAGLEERSEEHTSELQSRLHLVCRLLLEKKKQEKPTVREWRYVP